MERMASWSNNLEIRNDVWLDTKYQVQNVIYVSGLSNQLLQAKFIDSIQK